MDFIEIGHLNCTLALFINHCMTLRELLNLLNLHFFIFSKWITVTDKNYSNFPYARFYAQCFSCIKSLNLTTACILGLLPTLILKTNKHRERYPEIYFLGIYS